VVGDVGGGLTMVGVDGAYGGRRRRGTPLPGLDSWWLGLQPGARGRGVDDGPSGRLGWRWDGVVVASDVELGTGIREESRGGSARGSARRRRSGEGLLHYAHA
jgi:hypothetical protein